MSLVQTKTQNKRGCNLTPIERELWHCPKCGAPFANPNQWHSCGNFDLDALFSKSKPIVRHIFDRIVEMARQHGECQVVPQKSRVVLVDRMRFINGTPHKGHFTLGFILPERVDSPRFHKIETYAPNCHGHYLNVASLDQLDHEVENWIQLARICGRQEHLR